MLEQPRIAATFIDRSRYRRTARSTGQQGHCLYGERARHARAARPATAACANAGRAGPPLSDADAHAARSANHNAFRLIEQYRGRVPPFSEDIRRAAAVALAGIPSGLRVTPLRRHPSMRPG